MINATAYNANKYKDFQGTPYLWKENKEVIIIGANGKEYAGVTGNYNGLENEFEVYKEDKYIQLPHSDYVGIKVINDPEITYSLWSNIHPKLKNKYCILHANEDNYRVVESFISKESVVSFETPGKTTHIKKINSRSNYYIIKGGELISFDLKKKKLIKQFGHKNEINAFLKENKIKMKCIEDAILLFEFLDSKGWLF